MVTATEKQGSRSWGVFQTELLRKSIHVLIALTPSLASLNWSLTVYFLFLGIIFYAYCESERLSGRRLPLITRVTQMASRDRDRNKAVLGPLTLGLGALLCLFLYPEPAATVGIYALAFGDSLSSLVGRTLGRVRLPFTGGKSLEGSLAAFFAIFVSALAVHASLPLAFVVAAAGTFWEALPLEDLDNLVIPLGTGLVYAVCSGWL